MCPVYLFTGAKINFEKQLTLAFGTTVRSTMVLKTPQGAGVYRALHFVHAIMQLDPGNFLI
jgi:hypothetical protein